VSQALSACPQIETLPWPSFKCNLNVLFRMSGLSVVLVEQRITLRFRMFAACENVQ
jgi:hypothetical protein